MRETRLTQESLTRKNKYPLKVCINNNKGVSLSKKDLRLEYSGYVIFAAKMVSVATGLVFQFMVARALNKTEYDLYFNALTDVAGIFALLAGVLPFWAMRFAARDKEGAIKTGIVANLGISAAATLTYVLLIPLILPALEISAAYLPVYYIVAIQIVEMYSIAGLEASLQTRIPRKIGYGLIIQQFCKVIMGYVLIVLLGQLLIGVAVTTIIAFALQISYYVRLLAEELKQRFRREYVRQWLKGSIINIYNVAGGQMATFVFIMLLAYGGDGARGKLGAAAIIVNVITYSSFLAIALYPKLLAEKRSEDITVSLKMVLMFAIPLTIGAIALADSYVTILKPDHADAGPILIFLALNSLVSVISGLLGTVILGFDTVDEESRMSLRQLVRSRIFLAFSLPYVYAAITLPTTFYALTNFAHGQPFQAAFSVSIISFSASLATFFIQYIIVRKMVRIKPPWKNIAKYVFSAAIMGAVLYLVPHPTRLTTTLTETAIGGLIYIALLMAIDKETRKLPGTILKNLR